MRKNIRVEITQEDIDEGVRHDSYKCMFSRAVSRAMGALDSTIRDIRTTSNYVLASEPVGPAATRSIGWALTPTAARRIKAFDRGGSVKPFVTIMRGV